jgi:hypothetical protein
MPTIYIYLACILISFSAGIFTEHKMNVASQVDALYGQIAATKKAQEQGEAAAGATKAKTDQLVAVTDSFREILYAEKDSNPCSLPDDTIRMLQSTATAANSAAR